MSAPLCPPLALPRARDLGPPTPSEQTIIARILIRHGYPPPPPLGFEQAKAPRPW